MPDFQRLTKPIVKHALVGPKMTTLAFAFWRGLDTPGHEACRLEQYALGWRLQGTAVFWHKAGPASFNHSAGV
jgi:hypothetical protein